MSDLPSSVDYFASAASSAAKARGVVPSLPTDDPLDVATALKCMSAFQLRVDVKNLAPLDDEKAAAPLVAAARILQSTAQHLQRTAHWESQSDLDDLSFHAALAFSMHGNFPSARAALADVSQEYLQSSLTVWMVAAICDPTREIGRRPSNDGLQAFRGLWERALTHRDETVRIMAFDGVLEEFRQATRSGTMADKALSLGAQMAAHQAMRLAMANLFDAAPEIPVWFVANAIRAGMVTLLPPQRVLLAEDRIANHGRNTLLTLPTSTGKTFIAEACMAAGLGDEGLCVYVAPYVAVGEQVKEALRNHLREEVEVVSMFGGFQSERLNVFADREVVVATPERFDGWLRSTEDISQLRTVVFDEIHILENGVRGARVEGLVSRLRLLQRTNPGLRIIGLSAVLSAPQRVCDWMGVARQDLHEIGWRPTARRLAMCLANGDTYWIHGNDALRPPGLDARSELSEPVRVVLPGAIKPGRFATANQKSAAENVAAIARDMRERLGAPGLVVCPRKLDTRLLARTLVDEVDEVDDPMLHGVADDILRRYEYLGRLVACMKRGVAYHNASLPFDVRRDVERMTRERRLFVVCATTTLAEGADLPFRWTIVSHWLSSMRDDGTQMKSMTFRNIAGRCGRAGAFSEGDTILFENLLGPPSLKQNRSNVASMQAVMFTLTPLASTLGSDWADTPENGRRLLEAAFSAQLLACIREHPEADDVVSDLVDASYAGKTNGEENVRRILDSTLAGILDDTQPGGALATRNSPVRLTELGKAANLSGFSPATCRMMVQVLAAEEFELGPPLFAKLLKTFSDAPEQSNEVLRKIFSGNPHKNVLKADNFEKMLTDLLKPMDVRAVFDGLRSPKSKANEDSVENWFEDFVSFVDGVVGNFLPWLLRGLETLSSFGSEEAANIEWSGMAKEIEARLSSRGRPAEGEELLVEDD